MLVIEFSRSIFMIVGTQMHEHEKVIELHDFE